MNHHVACLMIRCEAEAFNHDFNSRLANKMVNLVVADIANEIDRLSYEFAVEAMLREHCPDDRKLGRFVECYKKIANEVGEFLETYDN